MFKLSNPKNIFALLIIMVALVFYYNFSVVFKSDYVDPITSEYENLNTAYISAADKLSLETLKDKKNQLTLQETNVMDNFVPIKLNSATFVYNLAQYANQNRLILKNMQYTISNEGNETDSSNKKLVIDFTLDGRYEDFARWMGLIENANTLISVESMRGSKAALTGDILTFNVKLIVHALDID